VILGWDVPVDVGRDEARAAAEHELSDPAYASAQPSFIERGLKWLGDRLSDLFNGVSGLGTGGVAGLVVLVLLAVLAVVLLRLRVGKLARTLRSRTGVFGDGRLAADDHRRASADAAARGAWDEAVPERFRAIVRELEERGVLDEGSGRTVDEIAAQAGGLLPASAGALRTAAGIFDDVVYGGRPATVDGYEYLVALDNELRTARPALVATP
jgi:uncharacterized protein DUF4129